MSNQLERYAQYIYFRSERIVVRKFLLLEIIGITNYRDFSLKIRFHRKFNIFSSESQEKPRILAKYVCITFAQYCNPPPSASHFYEELEQVYLRILLVVESDFLFSYFASTLG